MPYTPPFIKQLDGSRYAGTNCTVASSCMAAIRHRRGSNPPGTAQWYPTPSYVRYRMGDTSGGTNLQQNDSIFYRYWGINMEVRYKLGWSMFRTKIKAGQAAVLQGGYDVVRLTRFSGSSNFYGNHAVYVNEVRYNSTARRYEYKVGDPLCDGRRSGIPRGYQWWPESLLKSFAGRLMVGSYRLGIGYVYAMFTRDTEVTPTAPTLTLRYGAHSTTARKVYAKYEGVAMKKGPGSTFATIRRYSKGNYMLTRRQSTTGQWVNGSNRWYGNIDGTRWAPAGRTKF
jgi:hypothetical protein